jgi:bifunctional non-homologous end joining protein LigD
MATSKPRTRKPATARLATYEAKRRFDITPEPRGSSQASGQEEKKTAQSLAFVVQKHDARRLHYDFRFEIDGAMASWAVPKGPSYDPVARRLAVKVEDHPMEYNTFEGRIPDGQYGAGDVLVWDRGMYETVPPGQERAQVDEGHLRLRLFGEKLVGEWHLVRTDDSKKKGGAKGPVQVARGHSSPSSESAAAEVDEKGTSMWLLFKGKDRHANAAYDVVTERPESIVSGRQATRGPRRVNASEQGSSARGLHDAMGEPMLATSVTRITNPGQFLYEVKYDGYRLQACKAGDEVRLYTRKGNDWTDRFAPIARAIAALPARECVLDGEACAVDDSGKPSFHALQEWLAGEKKKASIGFAAFDLLWLDGRDVRREALESRRELLEKLLEGQKAPLSYSRAVEGDLAQLLETAKAAGLEGLMAKRKGTPYVAERSMDWLKLRFDRRQECAVVGWLPLSGNAASMGALLLGVVEDGALVFAGRVGTGFGDRERREWAVKLEPDRTGEPPAARAPVTKDAHWVTPKYVVECGFVEWTPEGSMRHPRFIGVREDKAPMECLKDAPVADDRPETPPPNPLLASEEGEKKAGSRTPPSLARGVGGPSSQPPKLSNPDKVLFPRDGITKRDVWDYYTAIAPVMLPHLAGRPLTMQRYPDGIAGEEWYQQNVPLKPPSFVRLVDSGARHDGKKRIVCDSLETLQWLANLAALTLHQWTSHVPPKAATRAAVDHALGLPDYVVIDLDPGDGPWSHLVEVAHAVRLLLDALKLECFAKTSGKRGIHVVVPIAPGPTHEQATGFAEQIARAVAKVLPDVATVERMKDKRGGKLYVDYGQNGEGRTVVSPYTIRARDGAVVSTPVTWDEVTEELDPTRFTIKNVPERVQRLGDLYEGVLAVKQRLPG